MDQRGIFALHALRLRALQLAVLPTEGKRPLIKGWQKWRWPPSIKSVEQLAVQFPNANIAILPGPSGVFIADVDAAEQVDEVEELLGPTPLHVATRRGRHLYYRAPDCSADLPSDLKGLGLYVDLKLANSIVVVPPSRHESGVLYRFCKGGWDSLQNLPAANFDKVRNFTDARARQGGKGRHVEGERGLGLNRVLCRHAPFVETFDELLDVARTTNADFLPPLGDAEVVRRTRAVWRDVLAGKLEAWVGRGATARTNTSEIKLLCRLGRNGADALTMLMFLRAEHGARCRRGEPFCIVAEAMARAQVLPGWHWKRIAAAQSFVEGRFDQDG